MEIIIDVFLILLGVYFALGILFGLYFLIKGASKIDPVLANSKKRVRILLLPGVIVTWLFLLPKVRKSNSAAS